MLFHTCDIPVQNDNLTGLFLQIWITVGWRKRECPFDYARSAKLSLFASSLLMPDVWPWIGTLKQWIIREKKNQKKTYSLNRFCLPWFVYSPWSLLISQRLVHNFTKQSFTRICMAKRKKVDSSRGTMSAPYYIHHPIYKNGQLGHIMAQNDGHGLEKHISGGKNLLGPL